jgi:hypothetical protein
MSFQVSSIAFGNSLAWVILMIVVQMTVNWFLDICVSYSIINICEEKKIHCESSPDHTLEEAI